ncbi:ABC-2 type transport system ATP-binding protein [Melghiribacillus thermohalophilus]|uniref:ABC-2 type transport system ATP-binding protein n=1 Tax=Melghiribacillus thermohalophilus TaxID=1324956 RepID=A0A4R3NAS7_9BACI|nr:ATP-binding cassette domain-containing protein [Melghiribacillus thermohalophilus]TCT26379.1 ABC-2 type transport system ATP-binding protein [Melghiribacillus thermohalophilus]
MIQVRNLTKSYKYKKILSEATLNIEGIYGLIGPNGAGKTTLMRILAGLVSVNEGEILVESDKFQSKDLKSVRNNIGYLPQDFNMYPKATVFECLEHIAILKGLKDRKERRNRIEQVLEQVNLLEATKQKVHKLSGGMRKRLGIAQVFLTDPGILIIDEPTAGLDIFERIRFRNLLREISKDKTIIIFSHIVEDVEFLCTKLGIIKEGKVLAEGTPSEIAQTSSGLVWEIQAHPDHLPEIFKQYTVIDIKQQDYNLLDIRILSEQKPNKATPLKPTLIDGYLSIINGWGIEKDEPIKI